MLFAALCDFSVIFHIQNRKEFRIRGEKHETSAAITTTEKSLSSKIDLETNEIRLKRYRTKSRFFFKFHLHKVSCESVRFFFLSFVSIVRCRHPSTSYDIFGVEMNAALKQK